MEIETKKLTPDMADEYLRYFEEVAFTDHDEWANCYCLESHLPREEMKQPFRIGNSGGIRQERWSRMV